MNSNTELIIYTTDDGVTKVEATFDGDTVWLSQEQMGELFQRDKSTISRHIRNIFTEGELDEKVVVAEIATTSPHGAIKGKTQNNITRVYNLDVISSSEKVLYRQVLDLYATSIDYNPKAPESVRFFKIVQNKLHFAAHGHTAAEVIYERADAEKPFMGLKSFAGEIPALKDIGIAKNYLTETELKVLNNLVSGYFDFAEISALERRPMYMKDYINQLDTILYSSNRKLLQNSGTISHTQALEKAKQEYRKYQEKTIAPVEQAYLDTIHDLEKEAKKQIRNRK